MRVQVEPAGDGTFRMADGLRPVSQPSSATRLAIRRLVDQATLDAIEQAAAIVAAPQLGAAVVNDALTIEDLKADWIRRPVVRLVQAIGILSSDPLNDKSIGRGKVKKRLARVATRAAEVADLYSFLSCFRGEIISEVWLPVVHASVEAAAHLHVALTVDTDAASEEACRRYEALRQEFEAEHYAVLATLPYLDYEVLELQMPTLEKYLSELFGIAVKRLPDARAPSAWIDLIRRQGLDPQEVAGTRFAFLDSLDFSDDDFLRTYMYFVFRLASSPFPLLANRSLQLTARLLTEADTADQQLTRDLVSSFFLTEASWIVASAPEYESAMADYLEKQELPAIVDALRRLSEGVLRPYGSLVAAIAAIRSRSNVAIPLEVAPTLGDLEQRLNPERSTIEALILPLISREWRNADAHARATVGPTGQLILKLDDGSVEQIDANHVFGNTSMLRSVLDGVDAAVNIFYVTKASPPPPPPEVLVQFSREMVRNLAQEAVYRSVQGAVADVTVSEGGLEITFVGRASRDELRAMLALVGRMTRGQYETVSAVNEKGKALAKVVRIDLEPAHSFYQMYRPG